MDSCYAERLLSEAVVSIGKFRESRDLEHLEAAIWRLLAVKNWAKREQDSSRKNDSDTSTMVAAIVMGGVV